MCEVLVQLGVAGVFGGLDSCEAGIIGWGCPGAVRCLSWRRIIWNCRVSLPSFGQPV